MKCQWCGASIPAEAKVCPNCGARLKREVTRCPHCKEGIRAGLSLCPHCGYELGRRRVPLWLIAGVSGAVVVIATLALFFLPFSLPSFSLPSFRLPSFRLPSFSLPSFRLPTLVSIVSPTPTEVLLPPTATLVPSTPTPTRRPIPPTPTLTSTPTTLPPTPAATATSTETAVPTATPTLATPILTPTPTPTPTASPTPAPTSASTAIPPPTPSAPTPTATPFPTDTPTPPPILTPTETPSFKYPAPRLSSPRNDLFGDFPIGGGDHVWLEWETLPLAEGEFYVVSVQFVQPDGKTGYCGAGVKEATWQVSREECYDKAHRQKRAFEWHIKVERERTNPDGSVERIPLSPTSETWVFYWR